MIPLERISDEVFVAKEPIVILGDEELIFIRQQALSSPRQRARICAHRRSEDLLHEMFIALSKQTYIQPHRHRQKSESFHIVEGEVDVVLFEDDGAIHEIVCLGPVGTGRACFYRLDSLRYHTLVIRSELLVMHEVTNGPFDRRLTEYAPFAPGEEDPELVIDYGVRLALQLTSYES
jgi:cupin fold WbuC family metalloprotein